PPIIHPAPAPVPPAPFTPPVVPASPTAFTISIRWDSSVAAAPAGFATDIVAAVQYLETQFSDPITMTINVGYNEVGGSPLSGGALGESLTNLSPISYATLRNAVASDARTATDAAVLASLPATSAIDGATYWVADAQAKALGMTVSGGGADGSVGFGAGSLFTFGDTANGGTVAAGTYDFFAAVVHEITEVMGRQMLTGATFGGSRTSETLLDLLHYAAPATRDLSARTAGYFSPDGGVSNLGAFNTASGGDAGDWASSASPDSFDAFATSGGIEGVTANDLTVLDAIGWDAAGAGGTTPPVNPPVTPPVTPPAVTPTGLDVTAETRFLAHAQGRSGLSAVSPLAMVTQSGGTPGDAFSYALGGAGAASFGLIDAGSGAILTTGWRGVAGATGGKLYALTVTATDQTANGNPFVTGAINVLVGENANDAMNLASITGVVAAAPTFIYGLGGNDTIDGSGMTGALYFDGGAGADTMTGGSGVNTYEYGGAVDSSATAMDIITNFHPGVDLIDLSGLGRELGAATAIDPSATTIGAGTIGWQTSGGNTFVYVNTAFRTETLGSANMKIELAGTVALTGDSFVHL
ncbi:MAG TPA: NF038122 family metalloprotease, partial [Tepidisphaeraceae bacterium]|nr:NF038122 family metalloprotease [Tepidisphaeraceae bacterium]